jgi:hypothetical protein
MSTKKTPMTIDAARRIQSQAAKVNGGKIAKGSFAAKALSAAAKNQNTSLKKNGVN